MNSSTFANPWELAKVALDATPIIEPYEHKSTIGNINDLDDDEGERGSTVVPSFLEVIQKLSSVHVNTTATEAELGAVPMLDERPLPTRQDTTLPTDEAARYAAARVRLLARIYVDGDSMVEHEARLAILTERLRKLLPPVTEDQWAALGEIANNLDRVAGRRQVLMNKLGLE